ncbi:hypothetical protein [Endozoicomonas euniceicola]|uniref:Uncharacterized protein n=1 Tax=Endozoicomonas euniceicola TaxID=1234143 RepID=A0ABY6GT20_9GAMM|nr:hypothetical protein [Endozoicomonas euniceicola]UYM15707.1 hypothetical protein NX720_23235 [Endozoicomonas euniceicola]
MSQIPGNKLSINYQTHGLKASDKNDESKVGRGLGKVKITNLAKPGNYLARQQSASTAGMSRHILLRERVTQVLPGEAVQQIVNNPKPSQIRNGASAGKPPIAPKPDLKSKPEASQQASSQSENISGTITTPADIEANQEIHPLDSASRAGVKASPLPESVQKIVEAGLNTKEGKKLQDVFMHYTHEVMAYVKQHYDGEGNPPVELQEAFYNGMIELAAHGDYLKSLWFIPSSTSGTLLRGLVSSTVPLGGMVASLAPVVTGVSRFKPRNKKKLALLASTIFQIRQAAAAKDEAMVGSITSTVTRKGLFTPDEQKRLFQTAMGLEPVSGIALRADLKNTLRDIDKLKIKLDNPDLSGAQRQALEAEQQNKRSAAASLRNMITAHDQVMAKGEKRSLDDVWDQSYLRLEQRLTKRLQEDLQTFHDKALLPASRKAFLNPEKIIRAAESELRKDAEGTARGKKKLLEQEGNTQESLTSEILAERKAGIKGILEQAIKAYQQKP